MSGFDFSHRPHPLAIPFLGLLFAVACGGEPFRGSGDAFPPLPDSPADQATWYRQTGQQLHTHGDVVTVFYEGAATEVGAWLAGELVPLTRINGTDVWVGTRTLPRLSEGLITFTYAVTRPDGSSERIGTPPFKWRGPLAPPPVETLPTLAGRIHVNELASDHLLSPRTVSVYVPPKHGTDASPLPVVYMADGGSVEFYARALEPAILAGRIRRIAIVGVHNGGYLGEIAADFSDYDSHKDLRAAEYLPALESDHFGRHERFFIEEVAEWAERTFHLSHESQDKAVFGFSNGGRFAATMGLMHPEAFGHVIAFSVAAGGPPQLPAAPDTSPSFHFAAGVWETMFHDRTSEFHEALMGAGVDTEFTSRVAGHEDVMWREEFVRVLTRAVAP